MARPRLTSHLPSNRSLMVREMGGGESPAAAPVVHPHATVALFLGGKATIWCGASYELNVGDVMLVPEGMPHYAVSMTAPEGIGLALCTSCMTSPAGKKLVQIFAEVSGGASAQRSLDSRSAARLRWIFDALRDELASGERWQELAIEGYLALIVATLLRATPSAKLTSGQAPEASVSARALTFIAHNATRGISLADVAQHVHRSAAHTAAVVKSDTGRTVVEWITHARLASARQFLLRTDDTIEAIGARVGFASASHFHRTFRRHHQATPAEWRAAHRGLAGSANSSQA